MVPLPFPRPFIYKKAPAPLRERREKARVGAGVLQTFIIEKRTVCVNASIIKWYWCQAAF